MDKITREEIMSILLKSSEKNNYTPTKIANDSCTIDEQFEKFAKENHIRKKETLILLYYILAKNIGKSLSARQLTSLMKEQLEESNACFDKNFSINDKTITSHIDLLIKLKVIEKLPRYCLTRKRDLSSSFRYYFNSDFSSDDIIENKHNIYENFLFNLFRKNGYSLKAGVVEHEERNEEKKRYIHMYNIDFICWKNNFATYVQNCTSPEENHLTLSEKENALNYTRDSIKRYIIVDENPDKAVNPRGIIYINKDQYNKILNQDDCY